MRSPSARATSAGAGRMNSDTPITETANCQPPMRMISRTGVERKGSHRIRLSRSFTGASGSCAFGGSIGTALVSGDFAR